MEDCGNLLVYAFSNNSLQQNEFCRINLMEQMRTEKILLRTTIPETCKDLNPHTETAVWDFSIL